MRVAFVERESAPERLVCEAELVFEAEAGPLAGMKLVGFSLWRSPEGEVYVTFPSRAFGTGSERRFFDYLRSVEGTAGRREAGEGVDPRGVPGQPQGRGLIGERARRARGTRPRARRCSRAGEGLARAFDPDGAHGTMQEPGAPAP